MAWPRRVLAEAAVDDLLEPGGGVEHLRWRGRVADGQLGLEDLVGEGDRLEGGDGVFAGDDRCQRPGDRRHGDGGRGGGGRSRGGRCRGGGGDRRGGRVLHGGGLAGAVVAAIEAQHRYGATGQHADRERGGARHQLPAPQHEARGYELAGTMR
jgi:hypothetical protein